MKRKVLFVAHHLTIGGIQKSLVSALNSIDYDTNEVTLYVRKDRLDLLPYINKNVAVVVNTDKTRYYRKPKAVLLQFLIFVSKALSLNNNVKKIKFRLNEYITNLMFKYEAQNYFEGKEYDVAISYWQGYNTLLVDKYVNAKKKIMFFQGSVDETHEVHQVVMPHFDNIVVEHEDIKKTLCSWYDNIDEKTVVLENHTNSQMLKSMSKEKNIEKQTNVTILCTCARFSKVKGIDLAVEAARILKEKNIGYKWYFVGDGPIRDKIEASIKQYNLEDYIVLTGMQKNPYPYMAVSDIYVQPSYEEALSISMLESQILCIPMVSTKTAGGLAMVKDGINGYLADIDAKALAAAIEKMITNSDERTKMREYLSSIDYSKEQSRYENDWRKLLEDKT